MARIRKDGFYDERTKAGRSKNKKHTRISIIVGFILAIVITIANGILNGFDTDHIVFGGLGCFFIGSALCGAILKLFRF